MTRTEARSIARQMSKAGFTAINLVEAFDTGEVRITGQNTIGNSRSVSSQADWDDLKKFEGQ